MISVRMEVGQENSNCRMKGWTLFQLTARSNLECSYNVKSAYIRSIGTMSLPTIFYGACTQAIKKKKEKKKKEVIPILAHKENKGTCKFTT